MFKTKYRETAKNFPEKVADPLCGDLATVDKHN